MSRKQWRKLGAGVLVSLFMGFASWSPAAAAEPTAAAAEQTEVSKRIVINLAARSIALFKNDEKVYLFPRPDIIKSYRKMLTRAGLTRLRVTP